MKNQIPTRKGLFLGISITIMLLVLTINLAYIQIILRKRMHKKS